MKERPPKKIKMNYMLICPICGYEMESWPGWVIINCKECIGNPGDHPRSMEAYKHPFVKKGA